jgi:glucosamine 6-phosphate synthetase-like amidotransferase/phosphosugar isomerase protein
MSQVSAPQSRVAAVAANIAAALADRLHFVVVAGPTALDAAQQSARELRRVAGVDADVVEAGSGAPVHPDAVVIGLLPSSWDFTCALSAVGELRRRGHHAVVVTDEAVVERAALEADWLMVVPPSAEERAPALIAQPVRLLARRLASA